MKKFILFDNDGVLLETEFWYYKSTEQAMADIGIQLDHNRYLANMAIGRSNWEDVADQGIGPDVIAAAKAKRDGYHRQYLRSQPLEIDGVVETLDRLSHVARMCIVTSCKRVHFETMHHNRGITKYMEFVLVREDYVQEKPHPEPYLAALRRFDAEPHEALVVEDSERGLRSAHAAGIDCIVVHNDFTSSQDFSLATTKIQALSELEPMFDVP